MDNDIVYKMALTQIPLVGAKTAKNLIGYCGGVKEIYNKSVALLKKGLDYNSKQWRYRY